MVLNRLSPSTEVCIRPTGSAGVSPATRRRRAILQAFSRFALIAGGTPALPVRKLRKNSKLRANSKSPSNRRPPSVILSDHFSQPVNREPMKKQKNISSAIIRLTILCLVLISALSVAEFLEHISAAPETPLTVILVRHAEKAVVPPENKDPDLSAAGQARAELIKKMFGEAGVTAIYVTQFKRTQQTVKPLADKLGVPVTQVEAKKTSDLIKQIRSQNAGQVIFIAGHNNTVPEIIAALGGPKLPNIPETDYDNLFILTVLNDRSTRLLKLKY